MKSFLLGACTLLLLLSVGRAQQLDNPLTIPISYYSEGVVGSGYSEFRITGLTSDSEIITAQGAGGEHVYSNLNLADLVPGREYNVSVTSVNCSLVTVHFQAGNAEIRVGPQGSGLVRQSSLTLGSNFNFVIRVDLVDESSDLTSKLVGKRGGEATSIAEDKPVWYVGLGTLRNGRSAGALGFREGVFSSALYTPSRLIYHSVDAGVSVTRTGGVITKVEAPSVVLNVAATSSTSYTIQACLPTSPTTPFITYTVRQYTVSGGSGLRIDKQEGSETWSTVLQKVGSTWTLFDWRRTSGTFDAVSNPITTVVSGATSDVTYGSGTGSMVKRKTYTAGELTGVVWGPGVTSAPTTSYAYYNSTANQGWPGTLQSMVEPSGKWQYNEYFNDPTDPRAGELKKIYRPWLDGPATTPGPYSNGYVETYDYEPNDVGTDVVRKSRAVTINNAAAGNTTWTYNWAVSANGRALVEITQRDYPSSGGTPLITRTVAHKENDPDTYYLDKLHSLTRPDGTKDAYAYFNGTWNATTGVFSAFSGGGARQMLIFHGQAGSGANTTPVSSWAQGTSPDIVTRTLDTVHLVPFLSTVSEVVVDNAGRLVYTAEHVYTGQSPLMERISGQVHTYGANNLLEKSKDVVRSIATTGGDVQVRYTYVGGLPATKIDIDGVKTAWTYDNALRNTIISTADGGTGNYPEKTQTFTYYNSGLKQTARECDCSPTVTTYTYETTGRLASLSEPKPGGGTLNTTYSYPTSRQTTVTLPTSATKITTFYLDGRLKEESGTGQIQRQFTPAFNGTHFVTTTQQGTSTANGWVEEKTDWLGRIVSQRTPRVTWTSGSNKVVRKAYSYDSTKGQLLSVSTRDEGNSDARILPDHLFVYGDLGLVIREGDDLTGNGTLGTNVIDRITDYERIHYKDGSGGWLFQETTSVFRTLNNDSDETTVSDRHTRLTRFNNGALHSANTPVLAEVSEFDASGRETRVQERANHSTRTRTRSTVQDGATQSAVTIWQDGYLKSEQSVSGVTRTYAYASTGLLTSVTEGTTNVATSYTYHTGTKYIASVVQTTGTSATATTTYAYTWNTGTPSHTISSTLAGNTAYTEYNALGLPWRTWGTAALPTLTIYDAYGRRTGLRTWQTGAFTGSTWPSPAGGELVTWNLDPATGAVTSKVYADGSDVIYTYNPRGQVKTREWARGVTTTYNYFDTSTALTGELSSIDYSDTTPDVSFTYTRTGALATVSDAAGNRTFNYRDDLLPNTEVFGAYYASNTLTTTYDSGAAWRAKGYSFNGNVATSISVGFEATTGRPKTIAGTRGGTSQTFTLTYASGTDWVSSVTNGGSFTRATPLLSASGGKFNALASVTTTWASKTLGQFTAQYDTTRGWRTGQDSGSSAGTHADSWTKLLNLGDGINAAAASYDGFGQLLGTGAPAWQNVAGSVSLPTRNLSWTYDLAGNRKTESEAGGASTTYSTAATNPNADGRLNQYESITGTRAEPGIAYDADGNLTQDSVWTYSYDAENRLKTLTKAGQTITMDYDYMGRRIRKTVTGTGAYDIKFLWTGWQLAAELAADGDTVNKVFVWGRDFSDAQGNAGGAGALLAQIAGSTISYAVPDVYGTIVGYITSANGGKLVAAVEYSPYGKGVNAAGTWQDYPIGFSGQYMDWEPGLVYYGMRHYAPKHGRFINRDPIEEQGGNNLYGFVGNSPYRGWDVLGLSDGVIVLDPIDVSGDTSTINAGGFGSTGEEMGYLFTSGFVSHMLDNWFGKWQPMLTAGNTVAPVPPISAKLKAALDKRAQAPKKTERWSDEKCKGLAAQIGSAQGSLDRSLNAMNGGRSFLDMSRADYVGGRMAPGSRSAADWVSTGSDSLSVAGALLMPWGSRTETAGVIVGGVSNITNTGLAGYAYSQGRYGDALMFGTAAVTDLMSVASNTIPALKVVTVPVDIGKGALGASMILIDIAQTQSARSAAESDYGNHFDRMQSIEDQKRADIGAQQALYNAHCK